LAKLTEPRANDVWIPLKNGKRRDFAESRGGGSPRSAWGYGSERTHQFERGLEEEQNIVIEEDSAKGQGGKKRSKKNKFLVHLDVIDDVPEGRSFVLTGQRTESQGERNKPGRRGLKIFEGKRSSTRGNGESLFEMGGEPIRVS